MSAAAIVRRLRRSCALLLFVLVSALPVAAAGPGERDKPHAKASSPADFKAFVESTWPLAQAAGVRRASFDSAVDGLTPDPSLAASAGKQAEFDRPLKAYFTDAVSPARIQRGRSEGVQLRQELTRIEQRFGVPREILLAAWAMETDFGRFRGDRDVLRSLATHAFTRDDRTLFSDEFVNALVMLDKGEVTRAKMKGSWAGAMGDPQFLPSAYLKYAVTYAGTGTPDIWDSPPDTLASIANFLKQSGWKRDLPWGAEVILPRNFEYSSLKRDFADWAALGANTADATALPAAGEATLFMPSGARGPAFLLSDNYWVLKAYNNSDSYALSLAFLANRIAGRPDLYGHWPEREKLWSRAEKAEVQRQLTTLGFYAGVIDGRFGPTSREAIHAYQVKAGDTPADGFPAPDLLRRLAKSVAGRAAP